MGFELTDQQKFILKEFSNGINMKINAFAGTGKTTTLKLLVENNPDKKFLVLVFNKSVADELQSKFPKNADISTIHSFALRKSKTKLGQFELNKNEKNLTLNIIDKFEIDYTLAQFYNNVFTKYCNSELKKINIETVTNLIDSDELLTEMFHYYRNHNDLSYGDIAKVIKEILLSMISGEIKFTHGGYLKYFQLYINEFKNGIKYDVIMLDEGQDTNPVSLDIFKSLNGQKVIVGDTHQGIYGRRGAINAMDSIDFKDFYITKSFRINKDTAEKGNLILHNYKSETKPLEAEFSEGGMKNGKSCHIFRTNAGIIYYLYNLYKTGSKEKFNLTRGKVEDIFHTALDLNKVINYYRSKKDDGIKDLEGIDERILYITKFKEEYSEFCNYIFNELNDYELKKNLELVLKLRENNISIFDIYNKAKDLYDKDADLYLSTAHTVKGLEYDSVTIENDFLSIFQMLYDRFLNDQKRVEKICKNTEYKSNIMYAMNYLEDLFFDKDKYNKDYKMRAIIEEINLMYVAITRSIKTLTIVSDDRKINAVEILLNTKRSDFKKVLYQTINDNSGSIICNQILLMEKGLYKGFLDIYGYDENCYDKEGYDIYGYDEEGFDKKGLDRGGYNKKGFNKEGYDREGFDKFGWDSEGYGRDGFDINGWNREGINQETGTIYDVNGFNINGYDKDGYNQQGYNKEGYDRRGFDRKGIHKKTGTKYDKKGYDVKGWDKDGYDTEGFDKHGYNKKGLDREGFNKIGWNTKGIYKYTGTRFDKEGYDINGLDKDGYNRLGRNKKGINKYTGTKYNELGYDRDGYNEDGRNRSCINKETKTKFDGDGYDINGYNRKGFNKDGIHKKTRTRYDENGWDIDGYDKDGYNIEGYDRDGYDINGFNKKGIHKETKTKYDKDGWDKDGYNKKGFDKYGWNRDFINQETGTKYDKDGWDKFGRDEKGINKYTGTKRDPFGYDRNKRKKPSNKKSSGNHSILGGDFDLKYWATK